MKQEISSERTDSCHMVDKNETFDKGLGSQKGVWSGT